MFFGQLHSLRNGFTAYNVISPAGRARCHRRSLEAVASRGPPMKFASACTVPSVGIVTTHNAIRVLSSSIKRKLRRRSAIEPVIGHMKIDGRLSRCQRHRKRHTHRRRPQSFARSRLRALLRPILIALWQVFAAIPVVSKETARWLQAGGQSPIGDIRFTT